ncbi:Putative uncharacterized transposon-derived protein F52C9.6 [Eumeta japonica]|uniref:Uncharacterized transposon-derived protein F52C9.6 n=1 Tax=Eumeta variegata TaxID=151549 RepID=A0A4C1W901_EUMVA|nr:Putative uncharacterized transposon-derived protein F52C9.6 [Eumeta japonica]
MLGQLEARALRTAATQRRVAASSHLLQMTLDFVIDVKVSKDYSAITHGFTQVKMPNTEARDQKDHYSLLSYLDLVSNNPDAPRNDKKKNRMETMEKYISKTGGIKKAYRELKNSMNWIVKIKSDRGKWNHRRTEILGTATSYYKKLYGNNKTEEEIDLANIISIPNILEAEVKKAIAIQSIDKTPVGKGVRQGDPLSPKLFSAVLKSIFRRLNWEEFGINVDGTLLTHLRFADDIMLFVKTPEDITKMIEDLAIESERVGLKLNPEKTRVMTNGNKTAIEVGNTEINYTDEYVYLGQLITLKEPMREEVKRRITNGWRSYWSLKEPMKDKKLHINIKRKLFNTCILPVLTYGCQSTTLTKEITNKLATRRYAMERSVECEEMRQVEKLCHKI